MSSLIQAVEATYKKPAVVEVRSGDTVRVHQRIQEGNKTRVQIFEGLVIRTRNMGSLNASILTRRIASGVGVEKGFMLHSPLIEKVEIIKRSKVRRNYLSYMRQRQGKSARLTGMDFDREAVNRANDAKKEEDEVEVPADDTQAAHEAEAALAEPQDNDQKTMNNEQEKANKKEESKEKQPVEAKAKDDSEKKQKGDKSENRGPEADNQEPANQTIDKAQTKKEKAEAFRQSQVTKK